MSGARKSRTTPAGPSRGPSGRCRDRASQPVLLANGFQQPFRCLVHQGVHTFETADEVGVGHLADVATWCVGQKRLKDGAAHPKGYVMIRVLFVCLGNICRSPMAEAVFMHKVRAAGLENVVEADSAGTGHWQIGNPPHSGTRAVLALRLVRVLVLVMVWSPFWQRKQPRCFLARRRDRVGRQGLRMRFSSPAAP